MYNSEGEAFHGPSVSILRNPHQVVAANSHSVRNSTEVLYIDRVLPYHDLIYLVDGG